MARHTAVDGQCPVNEMPADWCSDCRGLPDLPDLDLAIAGRFHASHAGRCMVCGQQWERGDPIGRTWDNIYVCGECAA